MNIRHLTLAAVLAACVTPGVPAIAEQPTPPPAASTPSGAMEFPYQRMMRQQMTPPAQQPSHAMPAPPYGYGHSGYYNSVPPMPPSPAKNMWHEKQAHRQNMENRLANIEAMLQQLLELHKAE